MPGQSFTEVSLWHISCLRVFTRQTGYPYIPAVHSPSSLSQPLYQRSQSPWGSKVQEHSQTVRVTMSSPSENLFSLLIRNLIFLLPHLHSLMDLYQPQSVPQLNIQTRRFKPRTFIFHSSEGWKSKVEELAGSFSSVVFSLACTRLLSLCLTRLSSVFVHHWQFLLMCLLISFLQRHQSHWVVPP